jgi:hypothetical protein
VRAGGGTGKERLGNRKGTEREQGERTGSARGRGCPRRRAMVWMHWTAKQEGQSRAWVPWCGGWERRSAHGGYGDGGAARPRLERAPAMAPSAAAPAQHHPRSSSGAADVAVAPMVAVPPPTSSAANHHHHHHHRRAGAPLSATSMAAPGTGTGTGTGTPPMDVVHHRRTSSMSSSLSSALPAPLQQVLYSLAHLPCPRLDPHLPCPLPISPRICQCYDI